MAARSSGRQGVGVYFVWPLSSACLAASLMNAGVSKSGSPAPKPTTSMPAFFMAPALALTARVIESATSFIRSARANIVRFLREKSRKRTDGRGRKQAARRVDALRASLKAEHESTRMDTNLHEQEGGFIRGGSCEFVWIRVPPDRSR